MTLLLILFVATLTLTAGTYLLVNRTLLQRETAKVRDRLSEVTAEATSATQTATPLFLDEGATRHLLQRVLEHFNIDRQLRSLIEQAGLSWPPGQVCVVALLGALAAFNAVWYMTPLGLIPATAAAGVIGAAPFLYVRRARTKRIEAFEAQFPDSLQFIARAMRSGHAFSVSLDMVHQEFPDPLGGEFRRTFEEQNLGLPMQTALENLGARMPLIDVQFFIAAVLLQKRTGGNLAEILDGLAGLIRERFKLRGQIRTISAHGKLSSMVLTAIPAVVGVLMWFVHREHMQFFIDNEMGQWMAGLAIGLQVLGYLIMRKIVNIEV